MLFNKHNDIKPDSLKIAKVIPIFKKGDSTSVNNYMPISILSPLNNFFEKFFMLS